MLGVKVARFEGGHGAFTVRMTGAEHLVQNVEVDAVPLEVVLDGSKTKIDEHHASIVTDHDVVRRQVAVRHRLSVKVAYRLSDRVQKGLNVNHRGVTKHVDERASVNLLQHQAILVHVRVQQSWDGQA
tara:strand:+ start:3200 stop:3583 length:384 start_codon:yes stop_codon:yes gene_type:complete